MEANSEGDECRWTYEVSKVLEDKRKGTSVVGGNVHSSCDACCSSLLMAALMAFFLYLLDVLKIQRTIKSGLLRWKDRKIKVKFSVQVITCAIIIKRGSHRIPWLLHGAKMSKQRAGERSR